MLLHDVSLIFGLTLNELHNKISRLVYKADSDINLRELDCSAIMQKTNP